MRKKFLAGLLVTAMVASMTACGSDPTANNNSSSDKNSDSGKKKVGISMPTKSLERWNRDGSYLEEQFKKEGYDVEITYSDNDTDQQVNDIQNMISDNVDILVVAAIDGDTLSTVLADAKDQNIPVVSYDRLIMNTDAISYYVSFDNYKVGQLQGQYIIDTLKLDGSKKKYNMEVTAGDPADNNATFFYNGAMDTLKKYIDDGTVKIVSKQQDFESVATPQWSTDEALNRMQNILSSYYADGKNQLDIALCSNDSTALGVTQAIESDYAGKNTPLITGQDGDVANLKNILDGKQAMTVYKAVANEAVVTLKLVKSVLDGNTPDESLTKEFDCECSYDTDSYDNGTGKIPSYLLTPEVITKDNYKEKLVDTGYYKEGSDGYLQAIE
ncbi:monosaccharide ABC transporter substrate-binding protein CUT2 family (TC 3.A.1.2.-) [Clostridium sp. CAG:253]|nr:monosaccharide ABC transporter substrate-binding protein CUT2 family (TC 3.A.1.2.-) [Clostridium sp. CAG:253]